MGAWVDVLDEFESRITTVEASLDQDMALSEEMLTPWTPPQDLAPIPRTLQERAAELLRRNTALEVRLREAMAVISRELGESRAKKSPRSAFSEAATPQYFDSAV